MLESLTASENRPSPCRSMKADTCSRICRRSLLPRPRCARHAAKISAAAAVAAPSGHPVMPYSVASSPASATSANRAAARLSCPSPPSTENSGNALIRSRNAQKSRGSWVSRSRKARPACPQCVTAARFNRVRERGATGESVQRIPGAIAPRRPGCPTGGRIARPSPGIRLPPSSC